MGEKPSAMSAFRAIKVPIQQTRAFSKLVEDYASNKEGLSNQYGLRPDIASFQQQIKSKAHFDSEHRYILVKSLTQQYARLKDVRIDSGRVEANVLSLERGNTFTVTTGHQLNLFTGPLYFWYKIVHAINLAKELKKEYPESNFVPVYWMATEDHDFEEINHIHLYGGVPQWSRPAGGAVGRLDNSGMDQVLSELSEVLGLSDNANYLRDLFNRAYLGQETLADATRYMVHELFASEGLVIVDGDDVELKELFHQAAGLELKEQVIYNTSKEAVAYLEKEYHVQVNPRRINLFYLTKDARNRFDRDEAGGWTVVDTDQKLTESEVDDLLKKHPKRFSPNAIMRPLYQEIILPNLAYIGGGAEVAYWMELKESFEAFEVPFPILFLRNSGLLVGKKENRKREKLGIEWSSLFLKVDELTNRKIAETTNEDLELKAFHEQIESIFTELEQIASRTDKSFIGAVNAQRQKQTNGLKNLEKRLLKAEKRKHDELVTRIQDLKWSLFPADKLQERYDNFIPYFEEYGSEFKKALLEHLDPLTFDFHILYLDE